jgi:hypothetical protein
VLLHTAAAPTRVRATTIILYLVIQFSSSSVQSTFPNRLGDNLVSKGSGFTSAVMSPQSGIGSGSTINDLLDAILRRLDSIEEKLQPLGRDLAGVGGAGDGALHADDNSGTRGAGNGDILAVGEGDDALPTDDNNGALRADGDSDVPSDGSSGDATTSVIGAIGFDSSLGASDILAAIGGRRHWRNMRRRLS